MLVDQPDYLDKMTTEYQSQSNYLPLASLDASRVEVPPLEVGKPGFGRGSRVAVWRTQNYLYTEVTDACPRQGTSVV